MAKNTGEIISKNNSKKYASMKDNPEFFPTPHVPIPRSEIELPDPLISPVRDEPAFAMPALSSENMSLSEEDIAYLDNTFKLRGHTLWKEGYKGLDRDFEISRIPDQEKYVLSLTLKEPPRLTTILVVDKDSNIGYENLSIPAGRSLGSEELKVLDEVLIKAQKLFMVTPGNHDSLILDLTKGYKGLAQQYLEMSIRDDGQELTIETRKFKTFGVVYVIPKTWLFNLSFCVWVDLESKVISGAGWKELPMSDGDWIRPNELYFIDNALKTYGNLGNDGDFSEGLQSLLDRHKVKIGRSKTEWWITLTSKSGIGGLEAFSIDIITGKLSLPLRVNFHK